MQKILLIDVRLWLYQEYHRNTSLLNILEALANIPVRGFKHIFFVYDTGKSKYHKRVYQNYKENRTKLRDKQTDQEKQRYKEFSKKYKDFKKVTKYFGRNISIPNTEADTMIEVLADKYKDNFEVYIASSDGDFNCLLDHPNIKQVTTRYDVLDGHGVYFKKGVSPEQLFWAKCLCGDTKDNVLGIHKLGEVKDQKTGKVFKRLVEDSLSLSELLKELQAMVDSGKGGMRLPDYSGQGIDSVDSVRALFDFNQELKRPYTDSDLDEDDLELLKEQVMTPKVPWNQEEFIQVCFEVLGQSTVVSENVKQFFNLRGA